MANRQLEPSELAKANELLATIRQRIIDLAGDDPELLFAYNRKVTKELSYDERGKPADRAILKRVKRAAQGGLCAKCAQPLPEKNIVLDRTEAWRGYTPENTRLLCEPCDRAIQSERRYT